MRPKAGCPDALRRLRFSVSGWFHIAAMTFGLVLFLLLAACGDGQSGETDGPDASVLEGNYYMGAYITNKEAKHYPYTIVVKFSSDGVVEWVDDNTVGPAANRDLRKYYGVYELDGRKLTITLSGEEPMACVVHDEGESITLDGETFNRIEPDGLYEATLRQFEE